MKYAKILAVFGAVVLLGAGSATLLDVYGTISGTADVKPALRVSEIKYSGTGEKIEVYNPSVSAVDLTKYEVFYDSEVKSLTAINGTDIPSKGIAVVVEDGYTPDYQRGVNYFNASTLSLIDSDSGSSLGFQTTSGIVLDNISYRGDCLSDRNSKHRLSVQNKTLVCEAPNIGGSTKLGGGN